jgi:hypothetical protein
MSDSSCEILSLWFSVKSLVAGLEAREVNKSVIANILFASMLQSRIRHGEWFTDTLWIYDYIKPYP